MHVHVSPDVPAGFTTVCLHNDSFREFDLQIVIALNERSFVYNFRRNGYFVISNHRSILITVPDPGSECFFFREVQIVLAVLKL